MGNGPFKMRSGNSPLKETKDWFNVRGYLKGEQGLIPDWKGESTAKTATKVSKAIQKGASNFMSDSKAVAGRIKDAALSDIRNVNKKLKDFTNSRHDRRRSERLRHEQGR